MYIIRSNSTEYYSVFKRDSAVIDPNSSQQVLTVSKLAKIAQIYLLFFNVNNDRSNDQKTAYIDLMFLVVNVE